MFDREHLHIGDSDVVGRWLAGAMRLAKSGSVQVRVGDSEAASVTAEKDMLRVDLRDPAAFRIQEDDTNIFEKLRTASELGRELAQAGVTVAFLRKGKEAVRIGKGAHPTLSKLVTRSDDIQLSSATQFAKLKSDFESD